MSNPGVIKLASLNDSAFISFPYRFVIEDNIGEAIHIHYKDIRLDLTIKEFLAFADQIAGIFDELVEARNFESRQYDETFLLGISASLADIQEFRDEKIRLSDILVDTYDASGKPVMTHIRESRVFKALNGIEAEDKARDQVNYFLPGESDLTSHQERIRINLKNIQEQGYPGKGGYIVVDEENRISDGQHRAAALYYLYGDMEIPVKRVVFKKHTEAQIPHCVEEREPEEKTEAEAQVQHQSLARRIWRKLRIVRWRTCAQAESDQARLEQQLEERVNKVSEDTRQLERTLERTLEEQERMLSQKLEEIERKQNLLLYRK